jgi:hypothetical protein
MQEQASIPGGIELNAYTVGKDAGIGTVREHSETPLPLTPPFKRAPAVALARVLDSVLPLDDIDILELPLFQDFFDSLIQHAKEFFRIVLDDVQYCDTGVLRELIAQEERRGNWNEIYGNERRRIAGREQYDYNEFIKTVAGCVQRTRGLPEPEQSTPHLHIAYYHAMQVRDMFRRLLSGIQEKLPDTNVLVAPLKLPYRALEKMALEDSDRRWTAHCVMDLGRGAIDCPNTGDMTKALRFLDACTSETRRDPGSNLYSGLVKELPEIQIVRVKDRFERPTKGGWADIFINFVFAVDPNRHVHELQIQHRELVLVRKGWGEDARYANLRVLAEFMQTSTQEAKLAK